MSQRGTAAAEAFEERGKMPTVSRFFGIEIRIHWREHPPPHFHAIYGEFEATFSIETLDRLGGLLPRRAQGFVVEWAMSHRSELRENWRRAAQRLPLVAIAGLDEEV